MALYQVTAGSKVLAADLNQLIQALRGIAAHPLLISGDYAGAYPLDIWSTQAGSQNLFRVRNSSGNLLNITGAGVRLSANGSQFDQIPLTDAGTQTVTNKNISGLTNTITNIPTSGLADGAVTEAKLAGTAVTQAKIAFDAVAGKNMGIAEGVTLKLNGNKATAANIWNAVTWDTEVYDAASGDAAGLHGTPNTRIVARLGGLYLFVFTPIWNNSATGHRRHRIAGNNRTKTFGSYNASVSGSGIELCYGSFVWLERLAIGDYRETQVWTPNASDTLIGGDDGCEFSCHRIGA